VDSPFRAGHQSDVTQFTRSGSRYILDDGVTVHYFFKFSFGVELSFHLKSSGSVADHPDTIRTNPNEKGSDGREIFSSGVRMA
jgi:hypothetical protein